MSNGPEVHIQHLIEDFLSAIDNKNIAVIEKVDKRTADLLGHPKFDKSKHSKSLARLKEVHAQAFQLVNEESHRVSDSLVSLRDNSEGLRGYFEVSGE